jgi:hypothetical protein
MKPQCAEFGLDPFGWDGSCRRREYDIRPLGKSVEPEEVADYLAEGWTCPSPEQFEKLRREFAARR